MSAHRSGDTLVLEVRERGTTPIPRDLFDALHAHEGFADLIADGIFTLVRSKGAGTAVRAGAFVGSAQLEGLGRISVVPKVPGALKALLEWSVPSDVRMSEAPSEVGDDSPILALFVTKFVEALAGYLSRGRLRMYDTRTRRGAVPRGRLDVRRTMALEARGHVGVTAFQERYLSPDNALNRYLALSLFAAEEYCASGSRSADLARVRTFASLFADTGWRSLATLPISCSQALFEDAMALAPSSDARVALQYGRALLSHLGAWPTESSLGVTLPHSFFLSLETLFEEAVRNVLSDAVTVVKGSSLGVSMFAERPGIYLADPDAVVTLNPARVVLDMKYRDLSRGLPGHGELYQLHSHAKSLGATAAALVYPMDSDTTNTWTLERMGSTRDGLSVFLGRVDIACISEGVTGFWQALRSEEAI